MHSDLTIRPEQTDDHVAIGQIISAAFAGKPYAAGDEAELVEALRIQNALTVSLVAESHGRVIGQIAFSPAQPTDGTQGWYALGPVAVEPAHQRSGVGGALIHAGMQAIEGLGARGCILTGDPAYYVRFGFELSPANVPDGEPAEFFMLKLLGEHRPTGPILFHPAFHSEL